MALSASSADKKTTMFRNYYAKNGHTPIFFLPLTYGLRYLRSKKSKNKFGFLLTYSYLCTRIVQSLRCRDGGMVDTRDLKSLGYCSCAGSSPARGTLRKKDLLSWQVLFLCLEQVERVGWGVTGVTGVTAFFAPLQTSISLIYIYNIYIIYINKIIFTFHHHVFHCHACHACHASMCLAASPYT